MSESKHTPGEWRIWGSDVVSDKHAYAGLVAAVYAGGRKASPEDIEELKANLRLICAAPALLAAAEGLLRSIDDDDTYRVDDDHSGIRGVPAQKWYEAMHAAVAKAKGETT